MGLRRARVMTQSLDTVECQVLRPTAQSLTGFGTSIWRWNSEKNTRMSKSTFLSKDYRDRDSSDSTMTLHNDGPSTMSHENTVSVL